jgi:preprotein translocase subunit YajC
MYSLLPILAQEDNDGGGAGGLLTFLPIILIGVAMYFLLIRPQRRRMRDQQALVSRLEEGDEVITNGGIYGFITAIDGDVLWVDIGVGEGDKQVEIRVHRSAVQRKIDPKTEPAGGEPVAESTADASDDPSSDD